MSLNHLTETSEKKYLRIGCEDIVVYGSASLPASTDINSVLLADGTQAAPSLSFQNESSTGIYRAGAGNPVLSILNDGIVDVITPGSVRINRGGTNLLNPLDVRLQVSQGQDVGNTITSFQGSGIRVEVVDQDLSAPNRPPQIAFTTGAGGDIKLNGKKGVQLYDNSAGPLTSVVCGTQTVLPTNATDGFLYVPATDNPPTGIATVFLGQAPIVIDSVNNKLYARVNGGWKSVSLT